MARQLWLADALRAAGLTVVEVPGWRDRGSTDYAPQGLLAHDTGSSSRNTTDAGEINVMINGRAGLPGPIAQLYLSRTGTWHVVTAGRSNHALTGWGGPYAGLGNRNLLGIEAQHADGEPWTEVQYRSYVRGVAAILTHTGWPTVAGHKEHQPGAKVDPSFNMDRFRADVRAEMEGEMQLTDVLKSGSTVGGALDTLLARTNYLANVLKLGERLDAILAAARDDGDTTVVLDPAALVELGEIREAIAAVPAAVVGEFVHDLADGATPAATT